MTPLRQADAGTQTDDQSLELFTYKTESRALSEATFAAGPGAVGKRQQSESLN